MSSPSPPNPYFPSSLKMPILRAGDAHCRSQTGLPGDRVLEQQMSPWPAPGCRAGHSFPGHIPELIPGLGSNPPTPAGVCQTAAEPPGENVEFLPFLKSCSHGRCTPGFSPWHLARRPQEHPNHAGGLGPEISPFSPSFSLYLSHTHGWVGSNLNQNLQISPKQGEFQQTRKLGLQPAVSPRVTQLIKRKAGAGIRKSSE